MTRVRRPLIRSCHSCRVFANADSLFYYAREARLGKRLLSPEEIQALLSRARDPVATHVTSVPITRSQIIEEDEMQEDDLSGGQGGFGGPEDDENQGVRGAGDGKSVHMASLFEGEKQEMDDPVNQEDQWLLQPSGDYPPHPPVDQSEATGVSQPAHSQPLMESWMLDREEAGIEEVGQNLKLFLRTMYVYVQMDGQGGIGAEGVDTVAADTGEADRNPNIAPQQSIPSIRTLEK